MRRNRAEVAFAHSVDAGFNLAAASPRPDVIVPTFRSSTAQRQDSSLRSGWKTFALGAPTPGAGSDRGRPTRRN
jgi:hypothetical protein